MQYGRFWQLDVEVVEAVVCVNRNRTYGSQREWKTESMSMEYAERLTEWQTENGIDDWWWKQKQNAVVGAWFWGDQYRLIQIFESLHCLSSRIIGVLPWSACISYMALITDQVDSKTSRLVAFESNVLTGASHFKTSSKSNIMETSSAEWWTEWTREWESSVDERMGEQSGWTSGWTSGQAK